jgi:two-component system nitrogen regulation response regulator GlnG
MQTSTSSDSLFVLVADDDEDLRAVVSEALRADGCTTLEARDGEELLELLRRAISEPEFRPDVVLTDVKMPGLSGLGVLEVLKRAQSSLPVVVMTALSDASVDTVAKRLGAVGVLRKPFRTDDMLSAVHNAKAARASDTS